MLGDRAQGIQIARVLFTDQQLNTGAPLDPGLQTTARRNRPQTQQLWRIRQRMALCQEQVVAENTTQARPAPQPGQRISQDRPTRPRLPALQGSGKARQVLRATTPGTGDHHPWAIEIKGKTLSSPGRKRGN